MTFSLGLQASLTPSQQAEAPQASAAAIERGEEQGIEVERLHQEPEEVGHDAVVTEDHGGLTGKLHNNSRREETREELQEEGDGSCRGRAPALTVERVQWLVSSLQKRVASFMNTATDFKIKVTKSWMWMKFRAHRSLLLEQTWRMNKEKSHLVLHRNGL